MLVLTSLNTLGITYNKDNKHDTTMAIYERILDLITLPKKLFHSHTITIGHDAPCTLDSIAEMWNDEIEHKLLENIKQTYHENPKNPDFKHNDEFKALVANYNDAPYPTFNNSYYILIKNPDTQEIEHKALLPLWLKESIKQYPESYILISGWFDTNKYNKKLFN